MTTKTANDILDRLAAAKGLPDLGDSGLYWINEIENTIYDIVTRLQPNKYLTDSTVSVVADTNEYSLPATFKSLSVNGAGLFVFDSDTDELTEILNETFRGSPNRGFWINEKTSKLVLTPMPDGTETLTLVYLPTLTPITAGTQSLLLDSRYEMLYNDWIYGYFLKDFQSAADQAAIAYTLSWANTFEQRLRKELPSTLKCISRPRYSTSDL